MTRRRYVQTCVEAPEGADGDGLRRLLQQVLTVVSASWAAVTDVDLVGEARESLLTPSDEIRIIPMLRLLTLLEQAKQVVWANVFLCATRQAAEQITASEDYVPALSKAEALVRVVDAGYYYVYGPVDQIESVRRELAGEDKEGFLEELDFPE